MSDANAGAAAGRSMAPSETGNEWATRQANWSVLILKIAQGDQGSMARLYDDTSQLVYSLAVRMLGNTADAEEVALDVYNQVWRSAERYSRDRGTVFAWIMNMTRSRAIDHIRSRALRNKTSEPIENADLLRDLADTPDRLSEVNQQRIKIRHAMGQLPPDQRVCIEMAFFSGLSHSELAEKLGEPLGTVKTRIRSGMLKLRSALGDLA